MAVMRRLKVEHWPVADREAWAEACRPGQRLRRGERAAHLAPQVRKDLEARYGALLGYLADTGRLDPDAPAASQVLPEAVEGLLAEAGPTWSSCTRAGVVQKIARMAQILAPDQDLTWLSERAQDLELEAVPNERFDRVFSSALLMEAGLTLVREAEIGVRRRRNWRANAMRNGLMMAMLAAIPIRGRSLLLLDLGRGFRRQGDTWWIVLGPGDTKSRRRDERAVPRYLNQAIASYLTFARPVLSGQEFVIGGEVDPLTGPLWLGEKGGRLEYSGLQIAIWTATEQTLGVRLSPHDFRRAGATTAAAEAGENLHLPAGVLQHRGRDTTDAGYNLPSSLEAGSKLLRLVRDLGS